MSTSVSPVETLPDEHRVAPSPATINDLAIRVGTVNGSGSQSANLVLLRALYGMGIPCSGKNVFPSNIEGLPTWFHIRANGKGYVGHRLDTPVLVCMNAQTAADDVRQLKPGAVCIYRDDIDLREQRDDVHFFAVPFQQLVEKAYPPDPKDKG
jgi:2-oxoglutarate ferredoxin oxidoreductase subunit alpha